MNLISVTGAVKIDVFAEDKNTAVKSLAETIEVMCDVPVYPVSCNPAIDGVIPSTYVLVLCGAVYADSIKQVERTLSDNLFKCIKDSQTAFFQECAIRLYEFNSDLVITISKGEADNGN